MTSVSAFDIHLLLESICWHLSPHDLRQCVLVSRTWNSNMSPFLWRFVRIHNSSSFQLFLQETQEALARYANTIRFLEIDTPDMLIAFNTQHLHNLTILKIDTITGSSSLFVDLISRSSNLRKLEMAYFSHFDPPSVIGRFLSVIRTHPRLESIKVYDNESIDLTMARRLLFSCGNLDKVYLEVVNQLSEDPLEDTEVWLNEWRELTGSESLTFKVRDLTFDGDVGYGRLYIAFLQWCPHVEKLTVPSTYDIPHCIQKMAYSIGSTMKELQHLDMSLTDMSGYWGRELIESCCPGLKSFNNAYYQQDPHLTIKALKKHQNTLTKVDLSANGLVWTATGLIQDFLCACPNLQTFVAMGPLDQRHRLPSSRYVVPQKQCDMERTARRSASFWACPNLKILKLCYKSRRWDTIGPGGGIERIQKGSIHGNQGLEYVPESLISQLGQLTRLEDLCLARVGVVRDGAEFTFWDMTEQQVQMSREQTSQLLSVLSTLSGLRRVEFRGLTQVIDSGKLDNAKQHWKHVMSLESW